jgi:hypothetical protein
MDNELRAFIQKAREQNLSDEQIRAKLLEAGWNKQAVSVAISGGSAQAAPSAFENVKRVFLQILIGCLVAAGLLCVVTVLVGSFNDIFAKALFTILLIAVHSLVSFGFITNKERQKTRDNLEFFSNFTFVIIVLSFITSLAGVWGILDGDLVWRLYLTYFVLLFATLHGEVLTKLLGKQDSIDKLVFSNYGFMIVVVLMLLPVIFVSDASLLGEVYYRFLAAFGIIDATLTLVAIIMHKLYLQKHPKAESAVFGQTNGSQPKRGMHPIVIILLAYLAFQFIGGILIAAIGGLGR